MLCNLRCNVSLNFLFKLNGNGVVKQQKTFFLFCFRFNILEIDTNDQP